MNLLKYFCHIKKKRIMVIFVIGFEEDVVPIKILGENIIN